MPPSSLGGAQGAPTRRYGAEESFAAHVQRVYLTLLPLFQTTDFGEGMASFLEKRPPSFEGR